MLSAPSGEGLMGLSTGPIASRCCTHWVLTEDPWDGTTDPLPVGARGAMD